MKNTLVAAIAFAIVPLLLAEVQVKADVVSETTLNSCVISKIGKVKYSKLDKFKVYVDKAKAPYSEPVIRLDSFSDTETLITTDHYFVRGFSRGEFFTEGVLSTWGLVTISPVAYTNNRGFKTYDAIEMTVKVDGSLFSLKTVGSRFLISPELANAFQNFTDVKVRLMLSNGTTFDYPIGSNTIKSWLLMRKAAQEGCLDN